MQFLAFYNMLLPRLATFFVVFLSPCLAQKSAYVERCKLMTNRFDQCIVSVFGDNQLDLTPSAYLSKNFPQFLDTLNGVNLKKLVLPENSFDQETYVAHNVFRNCHDYNRLTACIDIEMGRCLENNLSVDAIYRFVRGLVRRHGGADYESMPIVLHRIADAIMGMDLLCGQKIGQLDPYRKCFFNVFQQNRALGHDALELASASHIDGLCNRAQRFYNSLTFAVKRSCEKEFKKAGPKATNQVLTTSNRLFVMAIESNDIFSKARCRFSNEQPSQNRQFHVKNYEPSKNRGHVTPPSTKPRPKRPKTAHSTKSTWSRDGIRVVPVSGRRYFSIDYEDSISDSAATFLVSRHSVFLSLLALLVIF